MERNWKALHYAELNGREARKLGLLLSHCPYRRQYGLAIQLRAAWCRGWRAQDRDFALDKEIIQYAMESQRPAAKVQADGGLPEGIPPNH